MAANPDARHRPLLVAVEGIDGSGKTTLTGSLTDALAQRGICVTGHREPSDGPAGRLLRSLSQEGGDRDPMMLALLSTADRYDRQAQFAQQDGIVVSDRYYLSGLAYHAADGVNPLRYQRLNADVRRPDLYLFLHLDPEIAAGRLGNRARDRWERGDIATRIPQAYQAALRLVQATENAQVVQLDAAAAPRNVLGQALTILAPLITETEGALHG